VTAPRFTSARIERLLGIATAKCSATEHFPTAETAPPPALNNGITAQGKSSAPPPPEIPPAPVANLSTVDKLKGDALLALIRKNAEEDHARSRRR
jgi:hypothetical protein